MIRLVVVLAALLELGLARLLPETGGGLYIRLAAAAVVLLLPGGLIAHALGQRSVSATLVWTLAASAVALGITIGTGAPLGLALILLALITLGALPFAVRRTRPIRIPGTFAVGAAGVLFGILLWQAAGETQGDALFHLGRVRKLDELDSLSLEGVGEFADGSLHPGYAFPLWHGLLAMLGRLAGVDPADVVLHGPSVFAPIAFLAVYEAGQKLFRSAFAGGAVLVAQVSLMALAPGNGGAFTALSQPGTAARQMIVPATLALLFAFTSEASRAGLAALAAAGLVLTLVQPTYALFLLLVVAGYAAARTVLVRTDLRTLGTGLAALALPAGAVFLWLLPVVRETASHGPSEGELERALGRYADQLDISSEDRYRLAPELFTRSGAVAVAALFVLPLVAFAWRRRFAAFALGGSLVILGLTLVTFVFPSFADLVSLSQARRAAGFLPYAFALAGGAVVLGGLLRIFVLPLALAAGIALQIVYPGDFDSLLGDAGPALATWVAALGGAAALGWITVVRRPDFPERRAGLAFLAVLLFTFPVALHGLARLDPRDGDAAGDLTPGLVAAIRTLPERDIVFSDLETSYRIVAAAPLYVAAAPPAHVADTEDNRPYDRRADVRAFFRTGDLAIPRRYGASWLVVDRERFDVSPALPRRYSDSRYRLYRLGSALGTHRLTLQLDGGAAGEVDHVGKDPLEVESGLPPDRLADLLCRRDPVDHVLDPLAVGAFERREQELGRTGGEPPDALCEVDDADGLHRADVEDLS